MKGILTALALSFAAPVFAFNGQWITVDTKMAGVLKDKFKLDRVVASSSDGVVALEVSPYHIPYISYYLHAEEKRCGGFMAHDSLEQAVAAVEAEDLRSLAQLDFLDGLHLEQGNVVPALIAQVKEDTLRATITQMSSYHNRHFMNPAGTQSQEWLKDLWTSFGQNRSDFKVDFYRHSKWTQPSVIATLEGTDLNSEIIVIGGHADSIGRSMIDRSSSKAPGADDNASGIATVTETIRILLENGFRPRRTIMFMAYAAEEGGLLGSKEIAADFKRQNKNVINVLQFDMTNFKNPVKHIYLSSDFTGAGLGEFFGKMVDTYIKVPWGTMKCGYGCSDHASWHNAGFPAILVTEAPINQMNKNIHTELDTLDKSGSNAAASVPFAQLAVAFAVEAGKGQ